MLAILTRAAVCTLLALAIILSLTDANPHPLYAGSEGLTQAKATDRPAGLIVRAALD